MKFFDRTKYWYFSNHDKRLRYGDDRAIELGKTHWVFKKPKWCKQGLHASKNLEDAICYAPGPILWRVELRGLKEVDHDKTCAMGRKYVAGGYDISELLFRTALSYSDMEIIDNAVSWTESVNGFVKKYQLPSTSHYMLALYLGFYLNRGYRNPLLSSKYIDSLTDTNCLVTAISMVHTGIDNTVYEVLEECLDEIL